MIITKAKIIFANKAFYKIGSTVKSMKDKIMAVVIVFIKIVDISKK